MKMFTANKLNQKQNNYTKKGYLRSNFEEAKHTGCRKTRHAVFLYSWKEKRGFVLWSKCSLKTVLSILSELRHDC